MVRCIECRHLSIKQAGKLGRHGFGSCALLKRWEFVSAARPRECGAYAAAPAEQAAAGLAYLARLDAADAQRFGPTPTPIESPTP
jgi:hypothetical protein